MLTNDAQAIFQAGVAAADPYQAVARCLRMESDQLHIATAAGEWRSGAWSKIQLIAFGKAACAMLNAAQDFIPADRLKLPSIAVTNDENAVAIANAEVYAAGHPLPNQAGVMAAQRVAECVTNAQAGELVLVLVSGGGSALLPAPVAGITLEEKIATTQRLLASGATINEINCVRKHLSKLKGGGLARLIAPADCHALILSDVLGDELSAIASGPTVADDTRFADALAVVAHYRLSEAIPAAVLAYLQQGAAGEQPETLKAGDALLARCGHQLVASNAISVNAALDEAAALGYQVRLYSRQLCGEARLVAEQWARDAQAVERGQPVAWIAGGETTVTLRGTGRGGRNQEMALAFALAAERIGLSGDWLFLSGGTDGRDGPTDAAGGMVDAGSLQRMRAAGLSPEKALDNNDAYTALQAAGGLLMTGATGTNVADLQVLLLR